MSAFICTTCGYDSGGEVISVCPFCPASRDPAAGATPAREETALRDVVRQQIKNVGLVASNYRTLGATEWGEAEENAERLIMAAVAAALRERDAAREDAARGGCWGVGSMSTNPDAPWHPACPRCHGSGVVMDRCPGPGYPRAARAAAAEGRAP